MTAPDEKAERLAAALRANLARRKSQARARKAAAPAPAPPADEDAAPAPVAGGVIVSKGEPG
ncbi:hypothetical protein [Xanthobacter tagetidis]|jgi:hypothetical protein|uniref:Uncharacterized protein n=1 Tax=Xanthobacter tagetidis TaxID=60216 RepID=A0A3L7AA44_9HYPH|nr:hypothetical protein [Xanthobacter tagetidis]MBB6309383.1 hypothetical protein [Xanthobacter tagetidis]RLP76688.1 hypothetical protein D9R14_14975 [Xanthobacter tagetidis]